MLLSNSSPRPRLGVEVCLPPSQQQQQQDEENNPDQDRKNTPTTLKGFTAPDVKNDYLDSLGQKEGWSFYQQKYYQED